MHPNNVSELVRACLVNAAHNYNLGITCGEELASMANVQAIDAGASFQVRVVIRKAVMGIYPACEHCRKVRG